MHADATENIVKSSRNNSFCFSERTFTHGQACIGNCAIESQFLTSLCKCINFNKRYY